MLLYLSNFFFSFLAFQLLNKRTRLFSLSSNNAILEFLLEGSLEVREQWLDSRKDVDRGLKASCEAFILHATHHLLPNFLPTLEKVFLTNVFLV